MKLRHRRIFAAATAALASMGLMAAVAQASPPPAPYQDFAGCPSRAENAFVAECFKYEFSGGNFQLGGKNIPVTNTIVFRGGMRFANAEYLGNAEAGIVPVRQVVEGGLLGLTGNAGIDALLAGVNPLKVYATVELAGTPGQLESFPLQLPVKVHLENPFLGSGCYVGSAAEPIDLNLITGTTAPPAPNAPITGIESGAFVREADRPEVFVSAGGKFVDNSFAVPGASGCTLNVGSAHIDIDKFIDQAAALPSPAGHNSATLGFSLSVVSPTAVYPAS